jgi:hypothetical protein
MITHALTSSACVIIKAVTTGIMTAIKNQEECGLLSALLVWAIRTTIVMTRAWMAMLSMLTPPPTKNCRNMFPANSVHWTRGGSYSVMAKITAFSRHV